VKSTGETMHTRSVVQVSATTHKVARNCRIDAILTRFHLMPDKRDVNSFQEIDRKQNTEVVSTGEFPPEYLIKHPLQNTWTLWYYEPDRNKSWEESQREITSFDTAEDFWRYLYFCFSFPSFFSGM